MAKSKKEGQQK